MLAPLPVDWNEVKTITLLIGIEAAAEKTGLNVNSIKARSAREGWFAERHELVAGPAKARDKLAQHAAATGATIIPTAAEILQQFGQSSRSSLAIAGDKAAKRYEKMDPDELVLPEVAGAVKSWTGTLSTVHGWDAKDRAGAAQAVVNVNLLCVQPDEVQHEGYVEELANAAPKAIPS